MRKEGPLFDVRGKRYTKVSPWSSQSSGTLCQHVSIPAHAPFRLKIDLPSRRSTTSPDCTAPSPCALQSMPADCSALVRRLQLPRHRPGFHQIACSCASIFSDSLQKTIPHPVCPAGFLRVTVTNCGILGLQERAEAQVVRGSLWALRAPQVGRWGSRATHGAGQSTQSEEDIRAQDASQRKVDFLLW